MIRDYRGLWNGYLASLAHGAAKVRDMIGDVAGRYRAGSSITGYLKICKPTDSWKNRDPRSTPSSLMLFVGLVLSSNTWRTCGGGDRSLEHSPAELRGSDETLDAMRRRSQFWRGSRRNRSRQRNGLSPGTGLQTPGETGVRSFEILADSKRNTRFHGPRCGYSHSLIAPLPMASG
jgi:hypothetical protein